MSPLPRFAAILIAVVLMISGYRDAPSPNPDSPDKSVFPPAPVGELLAASSPIKEILLGNPELAWKLACSFRDFSDVLGRGNADFQTTQDFRNAYIGTVKILYAKQPGVEQFQGRLDAAIDKTFLASFATQGLTENGAVKSVPWSPQATSAAVAAFDAVSYQCRQAYLESAR